jgi:hypothetical protein
MIAGNMIGALNGTEQIVFDYEVPGFTFIDRTLGSLIGDMTGNAGLAAAFDNNYSQNFSSACRGAAVNSVGYVGKDWGVGVTKTVTQYKIWGTTDYGYDSGSSNNTITVSLYGSNTAPSSPANGTQLQTFSFTNAKNTLPQVVSTGITTTTAYRYHWLRFFTSGNELVVVAEVEFYENGIALSSISTGNILNGNEDGWYTIITCYQVTSAGGNQLQVRFNNDSSGSYGYRNIQAQSSGVSDSNGQSVSGVYIDSGNPPAGSTSFMVSRVYAKSGAVRLISHVCAERINGTTIDSVFTTGGVWNNTADNISSIQVVSPFATSIGVGTRIIILKSNNFTNGTPTGTITSPYAKGAWTRVGRVKLKGQANTVTFTGLDGDRDVIYYLSSDFLRYTDAGAVGVDVTINGDTATNYGYQYFYGSGTTVAAGRATAGRVVCDATGNAASTTGQLGLYLFAKSGFIRPSLVSSVSGITGTTVGESFVGGNSWNNTSSNITSLSILAGTGLYNLTTGSVFTLYALRPNG